MMRQASNREFELIAACCRPLGDSARAAAMREAAGFDLDWPHVLRLAQRHRVEPLVLAALHGAGVELPNEARTLAERVTAGATDRLALTAETLRLDALLEAAGIDRLFFKGATLERLAYGRTGFKQSRDIDILVGAQDVERAENLLVEQGYVCEFPGLEMAARMRMDPAVRGAFMRAEKETVWRRGKLIVEIHWRLANSRHLLLGVDLSAPRQSVELMPGRRVSTFAQPELFAYIALHGAAHGWFRLKWLADFVALVADAPHEELVAMHDRAISLRVGRCSAQALLLGEDLLGLALASDWSAQLRSGRAVRGMVAFATAVLTTAVPAGQADAQPRFRGRLLHSHWRSSRHWRYRLELVAIGWKRLRDLARKPFWRRTGLERGRVAAR